MYYSLIIWLYFCVHFSFKTVSKTCKNSSKTLHYIYTTEFQASSTSFHLGCFGHQMTENCREDIHRVCNVYIRPIQHSASEKYLWLWARGTKPNRKTWNKRTEKNIEFENLVNRLASSNLLWKWWKWFQRCRILSKTVQWPFMVIQGHWFPYKSKARLRFFILLATITSGELNSTRLQSCYGDFKLTFLDHLLI